MVQDIYIIDDNINSTERLKDLFRDEKEYNFQTITTAEIEIALKNIPSLIIINEDNISVDIIELCKTIRANEDNSITPIIVESSNTEKRHRLDILGTTVEYYLIKPIEEEYMHYVIKNIIRLININRRVSPLTGLPGNVQIHAELKKRLLNNEKFAVLYLDLDNFKSYNDSYGFIKGDEIIKFTAKTILNNVHKLVDNDSFVGHIGGDDFVAILSKTDYDNLCQNIMGEFDKEVLDYFNIDDRNKGYIEVVNRKGLVEQFPLTSISIGVVEVEPGAFSSILQIGEVGAQVKHYAKTIMGSSYVISRRHQNAYQN